MSLELADQFARTIEIQPALVYLRDELAGAVEVPIYIGRPDHNHTELEDLMLRVEGETKLLRPVRREFFCGRLRLMYFSESIQKTRCLPSSLQLCWQPAEDRDEDLTGMDLSFQAAPSNSRQVD